MSKDKLVWPTVQYVISHYMMMDADGDIVPDLESREITRKILIARLRFFFHHKLLLVNPFDLEGNFIDSAYHTCDFTKEGLELIRLKGDSWLKSKASKQDPPDMKLLEKTLKQIRIGTSGDI